MAQEAKPFAHRGEIQHIIPKASTDISSGDYVAMARNADPISRSILGAESRISPVGSSYACQWGVGIVDSRFNTNTVGATKYATPTSDEAMPVIRRGVVRLALAQTSGKVGDLIIYSSGATGVQLFKTDNFRRDVAVGRVWKDFSGATSGDPQQVELIEKPLSEKDIYFWLQNRPVTGCVIKVHSVANQMSSQVMAGATGDHNLVLIKGKGYDLARVTDFTAGAINPGASDLRFWWIAAKISTTGGGAGFKLKTCTAALTALASYTNSGVSCGLMIPKTWNSNLVPLALLIGFSATQITIGLDRIMNTGGLSIVKGPRRSNATKWYL